MSFCIQLCVCLCNFVFIFLVCRQINDFICDDWIILVGTVDHTVRSFDESVFVDPCITCQGVDQTDVRTFRCLDRAHTSVMGIVNVSDFESGTVSGKTARTQCGKTSLVCQLAQRITLIHELGQLGGSEELTHCSRDRFDVDQRLRSDRIDILCLHSFMDHTFHSGKTDTVLVLQKFSDAADPSVAQVVDIIKVAESGIQIQTIGDACEDIIFGDMLRDQLMDVLADGFFEICLLGVFCHELFQDRIVNALRDAHLIHVFLGEVDVFLDVNDHVGQDFDCSSVALDQDCRDCTVLDTLSQFFIHNCAGFGDHFAGAAMDDILCKSGADQTVLIRQFLIEFVTADFCQVVTLRIKEHGGDQVFCVLHLKRLTRTELVIELQDTALVIVRVVLLKAGKDLWLLAEHFYDLFIGADAQCTDQDRDRHFSCFVGMNIVNVVGVCLILKPCASVRNDVACIQLFS